MAVKHKQYTKSRISFCDWRRILQLRMLTYEVFASANCCWDSEDLTLTVTGSGPEVGPNKNSTDSLCATAINVFYNKLTSTFWQQTASIRLIAKKHRHYYFCFIRVIRKLCITFYFKNLLYQTTVYLMIKYRKIKMSTLIQPHISIWSIDCLLNYE